MRASKGVVGYSGIVSGGVVRTDLEKLLRRVFHAARTGSLTVTRNFMMGRYWHLLGLGGSFGCTCIIVLNRHRPFLRARVRCDFLDTLSRSIQSMIDWTTQVWGPVLDPELKP